MPRWARTAVVAMALHCGAEAPQAATANDVTVALRGAHRTAAFDSANPRFQEATSQLRRLLGHPVEIEVDSALFADEPAHFQRNVISAIEVIVGDLTWLQAHAVDALVFSTPRIQRIALRYDAAFAEAEPEVTLDDTGKVLVARGQGGEWQLSRNLVSKALLRAVRFAAVEAYVKIDPASVPKNEAQKYFDRLIDPNLVGAWVKPGPTLTPYPEIVTRVVKLVPIVKDDAPLAVQVRQWLFAQMTEYAKTYRDEEESVRALPPSSEWHRAEAQYLAWIKEQAPSSNKERSALAAVFTPGIDHQKIRYAFPGLDRFAIGSRIADQWVRAGHPPTDHVLLGDDAFIRCVCPPAADVHGDRRSASACNPAWYIGALEDPATLKRLGEMLLAEDDILLVEASFIATASLVGRTDQLDALLQLSRAIEPNEALWAAGFRAIGDSFNGSGDALRSEARRIWQAYPTRHGVVLYTLAWNARHASRPLPWGKFAQDFGTPITASDFQGFMDQGERALRVAVDIWPALAKGWPRAPALLQQLPAYFDVLARPAYGHITRPNDHTVARILQALCDEGAAADLKEVLGFFKKRAEGFHPSEDYVEDFSPKSCRH